MNILIGDNYRITSDSCNIILSKRVEQKDKSKPAKWGNDTFYPDVQWALRAIMRMDLCKSDATSIKELQADLVRCERKIELISREIEE
jgi:hypothetical protein